MLGILPILALIVLMVSAGVRQRQDGFTRESVLAGFVLWGSGIMLATEVLSLCGAVSFGPVLGFWILVLGLGAGWIYRHKGQLQIKFCGKGSWPCFEQVIFNRIIFFSCCLGLIALLAPPNTYDAMTYHMSRVMHWIQDRTTAYYPTHIPRQLYYPVFAEYAILHFQVLSHGDFWANFLQWMSMAGSLIGVSLIARELGAGRAGQIMAAFMAMTIPMGILQSGSTQTDYVETLWLCIFIFFLLCWQRSSAWTYAWGAGAGMGLAIATKGVALVIAVPFLLAALAGTIRQKEWKKIKALALMVVITALFYAGSFCRNMMFFHGHAAQVISADADSLVNARFGLEPFAANALRNIGLHAITPFMSINTDISNGISHIAGSLHIDLNNKAWTYNGIPFGPIDFRGNEDYLGNPLYLLLFMSVLLVFIFSPRFRGPRAGWYVVVWALGCMAFNGILKWQPWHARFHLPMFVLFAPVAGLVMEKFRPKWLVSGILGALFVSAWVIVLINVNKPIFSSISIFHPQDRQFMHFLRAKSPQSDYLEDMGMAQVLQKTGYKNIGLIMGPDENEYLWWVALNPSSDRHMRIESVDVHNGSGALKYPLGDFRPEAIIAIDEDRPQLNWNNAVYKTVWTRQTEDRKLSVLFKAS